MGHSPAFLAHLPRSPPRPGRRCFPRAAAASASSSPLAPLSVAEPVEAILFDMDGVLTNSEVPSRKVACQVFKELYGVEVKEADFIKFMGKGEEFYMKGVAAMYGLEARFDVATAKKRFFEIYLEQYAVPDSGLAFSGGRELIQACRDAGLRTALASAADRVKVEANLKASLIPLDLFDAVVTADGFKVLGRTTTPPGSHAGVEATPC